MLPSFLLSQDNKAYMGASKFLNMLQLNYVISCPLPLMISVETTSVPRRILDKTESRYSIDTFHSNFKHFNVS